MVAVLAFAPVLGLAVLIPVLFLGIVGIVIAVAVQVAYAIVVIQVFLEANRERKTLSSPLPSFQPPLPPQPVAAAARSKKPARQAKSRVAKSRMKPQSSKDPDPWRD